MIPEPQRRVLLALVDLLVGLEQPWVVTGSTGMALQGVTVEVMGALQKRIDDAWEDPVALAPERRWVTLADAQVPVLSLIHEERAYRALGRLERAELLRRWLDDNPGQVL